MLFRSSSSPDSQEAGEEEEESVFHPAKRKRSKKSSGEQSRKATHAAKERSRQREIAKSLETLRLLIPELSDITHASRNEILLGAISHIRRLEAQTQRP